MKRYVCALLMISLAIFSMSLALSPGHVKSNPISGIEQITDNAVDDFCVTIDLNSSGNPHIAWVNTEGAYYAFRSDGSWTINPILTNPPLKGSTQLHFGPEMMRMCLDSQDRPHIAWAKPIAGEPSGIQVFYSYLDNTNWITEQVTHWGSGVAELHNIRLVLDSQDKPHIVWDSRVGLWGVFYSEKTESGWSYETVRHSDTFNPSIALDENDVPYVMSQKFGTDLVLSHRVSENNWIAEQVLNSPASGSLTFDSLGNPHIVFTKDPQPSRLFYANKCTGSWEYTELANGDCRNLYVDITVDTNNGPHIVWSRQADSVVDIYYTSSQLGWVLQEVSSQPLDEVWSKIVIDETGTIHIVWNGPQIWDQQGGSEIYYLSTSLCIEATIDIDPNTLNLKSKGKWITAYIQLPEDYDANNIDVTTILLNGTVPVDVEGPTDIGDHDSDGVSDLMVKFSRSAVYGLVSQGDTKLAITGALSDCTKFEGSNLIRVIDSGKDHIDESNPSSVEN